MEVVIKYKAKNGLEFDDPYECEQYEKILDKTPGTLGGFLARLDEYKDTDYFAGTIFYRVDDKVCSICRCNFDFSDLYEGETITQSMKDAQNRVRCTIGDIRKTFKDIDPYTPCGGTYFVSSDPLMNEGRGSNIDCSKVFDD